MADGIWVRYTELSEVNDQLKSIVQELTDAASRTAKDSPNLTTAELSCVLSPK